MSYEIYYDRRVFKVGEDLYFIMLSSKYNNRSKKNWNPFEVSGQYILTKEEIVPMLKIYNKQDLWKSKYKYFEEGEFEKWVMAGIKNAITIEEAISYCHSNRLVLSSVIESGNKFIETTEDLIEALSCFDPINNRIKLEHRDFTPKERVKTNKEKEELTKYYILKLYSNESSIPKYFVRKSKSGYKFNYDKNSTHIRKFKTEKQAKDYAQSFKTYSNISCEVEEVNKSC